MPEKDWRNQEKWDAYEEAICNMVERTSTRVAHLHPVSTEDKHSERIEVSRRVCKMIEAGF